MVLNTYVYLSSSFPCIINLSHISRLICKRNIIEVLLHDHYYYIVFMQITSYAILEE